MAAHSSSPTVPIFSGKNYDYWSIKMKTLFMSLDLWDMIEKGDTVTTEGTSETNQNKIDRQRDAKALFTLQQAVSEIIFPRLMRAMTSKQAWVILQQDFQGNLKVKTIKF
ncbi:hypothetical protein I3842_11G156000 [Carya illinoinensis]|uniref:DUF4219 domain-containing protein n=1 Tax=Carya illinoinensis TaxID=32201 RepID=A0A922DQP4_CARIL|nr:hypothetical protein I3842_11G156000 [Carya illinoinensis]